MAEGHIDYPRPTSELDCARILNYTYLAESLITERLLREQQDYIRANYTRLVNLLPRPCGCINVNNKKCSTLDCYNKGQGIACSATCGRFCLNDPWDNDLFIIGKKTYLKYVEETGFGIYANEDLLPETNVGEMTGRIRKSFFGLDTEAANFAFRYDDISLVIDCFRQGNGCSRLKFSSDPNCISKIVVHEKMLKVVIVVIKKIPKDTELTLNFACRNNTTKDLPDVFNTNFEDYRTIVGFLKNDYTHVQPTLQGVLYEPVEFRHFERNSSGDLRRLVNSYPTHYAKRPVLYQETHRFFPHDEVFALIPENGQLVITGARVIHCYRNAHGIYIYVVRRTAPGLIDYNLPRWLIFHYQEDALFRRDHVFSEQDRNIVLDFATPHANTTMGQQLEFELVLDYVGKIQNGTIPDTAMVKSKTPGSIALGAPSYHLQVKSCESPNPPVPQKSTCNAVQVIKKTQQPLQVMVPRNHFARLEAEVDECQCHRLVILQPRNTYRVNLRKDFIDTVAEVESTAMMRRLFDNAVEEVSILAYSRMPKDSGISFQNLMQLVRNDLEFHYYWAAPHQQKFLRFSHYRTATEALSPGSMHLGWCSLCRKTHSFKNLKDQELHFNKKHCIVPQVYVCQKCQQKTKFPSEHREHLLVCDPEAASELRVDVMLFIMDAFVDFVDAEDVHVFLPGIPQQIENSPTLGEMQINTNTGRPKTTNVQVSNKSWRISKTEKQMDSWDDLIYAKHQTNEQTSEEESEQESTTQIRSSEESQYEDEDEEEC